MNPQNAIIGDADMYSTDLPETQVPQENLDDEKKMARFSKTAEFKRLKEYCEGRIQFYQEKLPNGSDVDSKVSVTDWVVANRIVAEFTMLLGAYENANEVVRNAAKRG